MKIGRFLTELFDK